MRQPEATDPAGSAQTASQDVFGTLRGWFDRETVGDLLQSLLLLAIGLVAARVVAASVVRLLRDRVTPQQRILVRRGVYYGILILFVLSAMREAGFDLGILLGAAGILTVALGFASQTSVSNVISGLFLLGENTFQVGDVIRVDQTTGEVLSIDWLSVKLRTFDNLFVRLPNETLLKTQIVNLTRFPIRRLDLPIGVAYREDVGRVREVLLAVADANPLCLDEPKPVVFHQGFGESAINLQFSVWVLRENLLELKSRIQHELKVAFDQAGIEIPFPQRTLTVSPGTPIRLDAAAGDDESEDGGNEGLSDDPRR